jgi:phage tail P2-like protein
MDLNNVSILNLMPPNLASDQKIKMAAEAFDEVLRDIIKKIPNISVIPNLVLNKTVDTVLIDLLAWQFHVDFYDPNMPAGVKRDLVLKSLDWHFRKGTPSVVEDIVSTVFSKAIVQEWFEYDGLPYRFRVATEESMPETETRNNLIRTINSVKNTRSLFETFSQLVFLIDEVVMNEQHQMEMRNKTLVDNFSSAGRLRRNGRFRRDGTFVNTEIEGYFIDRNGRYRRDESLIRGENYHRVPSKDIISPPFLRNTWERERFSITFDYGQYEERQLAQALRNTSLQRDSGIVRDGLSDKSVEEMFNTLGFNMVMVEEMATVEQSNVAVGIGFSDTLPKRRNNTIRRDGNTYRGTNGIGEVQRIDMVVDSFADTVSTTETLRMWYKKHHFRDAGFTRDDGVLLRDSMVLIPLE